MTENLKKQIEHLNDKEGKEVYELLRQKYEGRVRFHEYDGMKALHADEFEGTQMLVIQEGEARDYPNAENVVTFAIVEDEEARIFHLHREDLFTTARFLDELYERYNPESD